MDFINTIFIYKFIFYSLISLIFVSLLSSTVGSFIVINRFSYIAGAISHGLLGGIGLFNFVYRYTKIVFFLPQNGGFIFTIIYSIIIYFLLKNKKERLDSILSIIWSIGMALGILFIYLTPGYNQDLTRYLFGNILLIDLNKLILLIFYSIFLTILYVLFFNVIYIFGFDEEHLILKNFKTKIILFFIILFISLTVFFLIQIVGIVLIIAFFTIPTITELNIEKKIKRSIFISFLLNLVSSYISFFLSYKFNLPLSPIIILILSFFYLLSLILNRINKFNLKN